jgi:poly(A) polymerase
MADPIKEATGICKTIMRNGFDAYIVNAPLQKKVLARDSGEIDICSDLDFNGLSKLFPNAHNPVERDMTAVLVEGGIRFNFYPADTEESSSAESGQAMYTRRILKKLEECGELSLTMACPYIPTAEETSDGFADFSGGVIRLEGVPEETLKRNYLRAFRALRFSANYNLPVEPNTWMAIVRSAQIVLDHVAVSEIMDEWRKVEAENLWKYVELLFESMILHGLIPEIAALSRIKHIKNAEEGEETVLSHTLQTMRHYPEELPFDWFGTVACLFHDVGKLYTGEHADGKMTYYHHHHIGAKVTRGILRRLRFVSEDIDLICHLVRHHMRFHFMLTDRGIRRFKALDEYPRLIEMARADLKAKGGNYTEFNHNVKMLERADIHEDMIEPLLNGHEIMQHTQIRPGPSVGLIRDALLQAQIVGDVTQIDEAVEFVRKYTEREKLL